MDDNDQRELEKKWRAELEKMGVEVVKLKFDRSNVGPGRGAAFKDLLPNGMPEATRGFVEDWLAEKGHEKQGSINRRLIFYGGVSLLGILVALGIYSAGK